MGFERDPVINVVQRGIKRDIRLLLEHEAWRGAILLTYAGMDAMAYLAMPMGQSQVARDDFVTWAGHYVRFDGPNQLSGEELYGARCATLHSYGTESRQSRLNGVRQIGYMDHSVPPVRENPAIPDLVLVSVPALSQAFFVGVDQFMVDVFVDPMRAKVVEGRFEKLIHILSFDSDGPNSAPG